MSPEREPSATVPLASAAAWAELPERTALVVSGADAVTFVDKFATAALARLEPGRGTESFFADVRGQVLALVNVLRTADGLRIDAFPGVGPRLHEHLEHYHIREDVSFADGGIDAATLLVAGPRAAAWLADRGVDLPATPLAHGPARPGGIPVECVALDWWGPGGRLLRVARGDLVRLTDWLRREGLPVASPTELEASRVEAGTPAPADIVARTLPQELSRDARAISFTKGCYLGQETVARLDALGHVNRRLVTLAWDAAGPPPAGAAVTCAGESLGAVTSGCASPRLGCGLGLALVHLRGLGPGARLEIADVPARAVPPPAGAGREPS